MAEQEQVPQGREWELIKRPGTGVEVVGPEIRSNVTVVPLATLQEADEERREAERRSIVAENRADAIRKKTLAEVEEAQTGADAVRAGAYAEFAWLNPHVNRQEAAEERGGFIEPFEAGMKAALATLKDPEQVDEEACERCGGDGSFAYPWDAGCTGKHERSQQGDVILTRSDAQLLARFFVSGSDAFSPAEKRALDAIAARCGYSEYAQVDEAESSEKPTCDCRPGWDGSGAHHQFDCAIYSQPTTGETPEAGEPEFGPDDRRHIDQLRKTAKAQQEAEDGFTQIAGEENERLADRLEREWFPAAALASPPDDDPHPSTEQKEER